MLCVSIAVYVPGLQLRLHNSNIRSRYVRAQSVRNTYLVSTDRIVECVEKETIINISRLSALLKLKTLSLCYFDC